MVHLHIINIECAECLASGLYEEKSMRLEEHHACACQCSQTAASCDPITQFWNPGLCQCECLPNYQEDQMNCGGNFQVGCEQLIASRPRYHGQTTAENNICIQE